MPITIREIDTGNSEELRQVARLRYQVTVDEMGLCMRHANHRDRTVIEPLDHNGHVFAAYADGKVVGTMRQNFVREGCVGEYYQAYGVESLPAHSLANVSVTTRLVVAQEYRRSRVSLMLPLHGYAYCHERGITHDVIDSRPHLTAFFRKLGYRTHCGDWGHPEFGNVVVQYLSVDDAGHLRKVGSPFLSRCRTLNDGQQKAVVV